MSQHDLSIANQGFPAFRSDLNDALQALGSMQSGASAPATTYANMLWYDTTNNIVKMRNEDNDAWISLLTLDQSGDLVSEISAGKFIGTDTTDASSTTAAAVKTAGGLAVAKKLYVGTGGAVVEGLTVGKGAGAVSTNTAVGASALGLNSTGAYNTATGRYSLFNTTGSSNTGLGANSLYANTSGASNTAAGVGAIGSNTTGSYNTAVGDSALTSNTTASNNTAVGYQAGYSNTTGYSNTSIGFVSGYSLTTGYLNTFVGKDAGYYVTTGAKNTIIGGYTGNGGGLDIRTANNYIVLSDGDGNPRFFTNSNGGFAWSNGSSWYTTTGSEFSLNQTQTNQDTLHCINSSASPYGMFVRFTGADPNNTTNYVFGSYASTSSTYIYRIWSNGTVSARSDARLKKNIEPARNGYLEDLSQVEIVKYNWYNHEDGTPKELGWIAQQIETVFPGLVQTDVAEDGTESKSVKLSVFTPMLIKALQELNAQVKELKAEINQLKGS